MPWFTRFDKPIDVPKQSPLRTLAEAGWYIVELSGNEGDRAEWKSVVAMLADGAGGRTSRLRDRQWCAPCYERASQKAEAGYVVSTGEAISIWCAWTRNHTGKSSKLRHARRSEAGLIN